MRRNNKTITQRWRKAKLKFGLEVREDPNPGPNPSPAPVFATETGRLEPPSASPAGLAQVFVQHGC